MHIVYSRHVLYDQRQPVCQTVAWLRAIINQAGLKVTIDVYPGFKLRLFRFDCPCLPCARTIANSRGGAPVDREPVPSPISRNPKLQQKLVGGTQPSLAGLHRLPAPSVS